MLRIGLVLLAAAIVAAGSPERAAATTVPVPAPTGLALWSISGLSCPAAAWCLATGGGSNGAAGTAGSFFEVWDGRAWTPVSSPAPPGESGLDPAGVSCASQSACMAVGSGSSGDTSPLAAEWWNGRGWDLRSIPSPANSIGSGFRDVTCATASSCVAVGDYETAGTAVEPLVEAWNGSSWTFQPSPAVVGTSCNQGVTSFYEMMSCVAELSDMSCASPSYCVAVGTYELGPAVGPLVETWNGGAWQVEPAPTPPGTAQLAAVSCPLPSWCVAVGSGAPQGQPLSSAPVAKALIDGHWTVETPPPPPPGAILGGLSQVACNVYLVCIATGDYQDASGTHHALAYVRSNGVWSPDPDLADLTGVTAMSCGPLSCEVLGGSAASQGSQLVAQQLTEPPPPAQGAPAGGSVFRLDTPGAASCLPARSLLTAALSATVTNRARARTYAFVAARLYVDRRARPTVTIRRLPARTSVSTGELPPGRHSLTVRITLRHKHVTSPAGSARASFAICTE